MQEEVYRVNMSLTGVVIEVRPAYSNLCHDWGLINHVEPYEDMLSTWVSTNDIDDITNKATKNYEKYQGGKLK